MAELAHFQNFAKLKDTSIEFNDITVLAGKPGTGKSYVMKMMYAYDEALHRVIKEGNDNLKEFQEFEDKLNILSDFFKKNPSTDLSDLLEKEIKILEVKINNSLNKPKKYLSTEDEKKLSLTKVFDNILKAIFGNLLQISDNFNVTYKNLKIENNENSLFPILEDNRSLPLNTVFVETPLILEFHKHIDRRKAKTPYHIESLINILDEDYSFTNEEQDELIKSFSQKVNSIIGGDIKNRDGSFVFSRNDDKDYNIFNASSGIKSIGLLQYLVTNKALKKGSVLFWEEPEVHLHPSWQLKMVDLFVELMNAGIKIVFSTHSPYMADYLNAISQKNEFRDRVSFNLLKESDGVVENIILDEDSWHEIQTELLDPLEEIVWEYL